MKIFKTVWDTLRELNSCWVGLVLHFLIIIWTFCLFSLPEGTTIRPLEWLVNSVSLNLAVFPIALLLALYDWWTGKKPVAVAGFFLCSSLYVAMFSHFLIFALMKRILQFG